MISWNHVKGRLKVSLLVSLFIYFSSVLTKTPSDQSMSMALE